MNVSTSNTKPSKRDYWITPQWFVNQIADITNLSFVLDACASDGNQKADYFINEEGNGLTADWREWSADMNLAGTAIWVNPPFSQLDLWIDKIIEEKQNGLTICMVHPDLSDPDWSQKIDDNCFLQLVPRKRLNYINPETGKPAGSIPFNSCVSVFNGMPNNTVQSIRFDLNKPVKQKEVA